MPAKDRTLSVKILGDASSAQKALRSVQKEADATGKKIGATADRFSQFGKKMTLFTTLPIAGALGAATKAAADEGKEMAVLANTLARATGATKANIAETEKWITKTQNATGIADGELRPALARLVMATGNTSKAQKLLGTAMDVSVARGVSLESVATALSKAYLGNTAGLARMGVAVKDASGKALTLDQILANLNKTTGGAAAAAADTAAGRLAILRARFSDMQEDVGTKLIPILEKVTGVLGKVMGAFGALPEGGQQFVIIAALATAAVGPISSVIGMVLKLSTAMKGATVQAALLRTGLIGIGVAGAAALGKLIGAKIFERVVIRARGEAKATANEYVRTFNNEMRRGDAKGAADWLKTINAGTSPVLREAADAIKKMGFALDENGGLVDANATKVENLGKKAKGTKLNFDELKGAVDGFRTELDKLTGPALELGAAEDRLAEQRENFARFLATPREQTGPGAQTPEARAREERALARELVQSAQDVVAARARSGVIPSDARSQQANLLIELNNLKIEYPKVNALVDSFASKIKQLPDSKGVRLYVDTIEATQRLEDFKAKLAAVAQVVPMFGSGLGNALLGLTRAGGGGMTNNTTINNNIDARGNDPEAVDRAIARGWRRRGRGR